MSEVVKTDDGGWLFRVRVPPIPTPPLGDKLSCLCVSGDYDTEEFRADDDESIRDAILLYGNTGGITGSLSVRTVEDHEGEFYLSRFQTDPPRWTEWILTR